MGWQVRRELGAEGMSLPWLDVEGSLGADVDDRVVKEARLRARFQ
jgi:hypothetical protein